MRVFWSGIGMIFSNEWLMRTCVLAYLEAFQPCMKLGVLMHLPDATIHQYLFAARDMVI